MSNSRREFLTQSTLTLLGAAASATSTLAQNPATPATPGAPPAFGTAPAVGPEVTANTFTEAEKLVQFPLTEKDRAQVAGNWRSAMAPLYERRVGPRKVPIPDTTAPWSRWACTLPGTNPNPNALALTPNGCQLYVHDHANNQVDAITVSSDVVAAARWASSWKKIPERYWVPRSQPCRFSVVGS